MNRLLPGTVLLALGLSFAAQAADEPASKTNMSEAIKARIAEEAKQGKGKVVGPAKTQAAAEAANPTPPPVPAKAAPQTEAEKAKAAENAKAQAQEPTLLDPVEVRKRKITEFEKDVHKQEAEIIREKKLTQQSEADKALNNSAVAKALAVFGGESSEYRANVAKERVAMMEDEKDLIEAINQAKTKEEKQLLQKQLEELKKMRRELERSLK
jgi:hypothetical protein